MRPPTRSAASRDDLHRSAAARRALPLRGSFAEIADLLRESALKNELASREAWPSSRADAVEYAMLLPPTEDLLTSELAAADFEFVTTDVRLRTLRFSSVREFFQGPDRPPFCCCRSSAPTSQCGTMRRSRTCATRPTSTGVDGVRAQRARRRGERAPHRHPRFLVRSRGELSPQADPVAQRPRAAEKKDREREP